jgi:hypothetical protein
MEQKETSENHCRWWWKAGMRFYSGVTSTEKPLESEGIAAWVVNARHG